MLYLVFPGRLKTQSTPVPWSWPRTVRGGEATQLSPWQRCDDAIAAGQRFGIDPSLSLLGVRTNIALSEGRADDALDQAKQAVELARARGEAAGLNQALRYSVLAHTTVGDRAGALADAEKLLALRHRVPNIQFEQAALIMAAYALADSEPERALDLAQEAVALLGPRETHVASWGIVGDIAARNGERLEALAYFDKAIDAIHWQDQRTALGPVLARVGALLAADNPEAAAVLFGAGDAMTPRYAHTRHHEEAREQAMTTLEAVIGKAGYTELHARGEAMSESDITQYAHTAITHTLNEHRSELVTPAQGEPAEAERHDRPA
jgi:tetratricopeptide (TPR) repeat protein